MTGKQTKRIAEQRGRRAEFFASWFLWVKGYQILAERWKTKLGEIDLIVRRGKVLVFVEVKYRKTGAKPENVTEFQASRMVRAANLYLANNPLEPEMEVRFDLILCGGAKLPRHIKGAFTADAWSMKAIT